MSATTAALGTIAIVSALLLNGCAGEAEATVEPVQNFVQNTCTHGQVCRTEDLSGSLLNWRLRRFENFDVVLNITSASEAAPALVLVRFHAMVRHRLLTARLIDYSLSGGVRGPVSDPGAFSTNPAARFPHRMHGVALGSEHLGAHALEHLLRTTPQHCRRRLPEIWTSELVHCVQDHAARVLPDRGLGQLSILRLPGLRRPGGNPARRRSGSEQPDCGGQVSGVTEGIRTPNNRNHNPGLYL